MRNRGRSVYSGLEIGIQKPIEQARADLEHISKFTQDWIIWRFFLFFSFLAGVGLRCHTAGPGVEDDSFFSPNYEKIE